MDLADVRKKNQELRDKFEAGKKELVSFFSKQCEDLFNECEGLDSFSWTQWTPYFNDGDPCDFGVNAEYDYYLNEANDGCGEFFYGIEDYTKEQFDELYDEYPNLKKIKNIKKVAELIPKFIMSFDEEVLECFGEGLITIYKNGEVKAEHVDHD